MKKNLRNILLDRIKDPDRPLRSNLTPESVDDLVFSIKEVGIIQPLVVTESDGGYELIAGHRRLLAAEIAGLVEAPCIIVDAKDLDKEVLKMHENIAREDINPIDWANHLAYLKQRYHLSDAKLAELTRFSETWVRQHLDILNYPVEVLQSIKEGTLSFSAARELAQIKDPVKRQVHVKAAVRGGISPAMAVEWRKRANAETPTPQTQEINQEDSQNTINNTILQNICPVCGEQIPYEQMVTLIVHTNCQPQRQT